MLQAVARPSVLKNTSDASHREILRSFVVREKKRVKSNFRRNGIAPLSVVAKEFYASDDATAESLFGDKIFICTPSCFKYISIDELHERQKNGQDEPQNHCPLCQISALEHLLFAIHLNDTVEFPHHRFTDSFDGSNHTQKPKQLFNAANPRAPPSFISL